ncbi:helix-turn-helix domain-containing protein [Evansella tamaricis]|uniref:Helix-turn-helix transcriptional regulator n=1 Tax=Evansella tamaricis TaxID=2069301 RepID=A0ABS6JLB9_9BACI|nr:helix-turn-helix transcriptional regulator [Evansella tamaricis]MBU9714448.1 helix-turn-helix transcriptional regulator [Evansella tamaricis]
MDHNQIDTLNQLKRMKSITNIELSKQLGISPGLLSMWFNHKANMSDTKAQKVKEYIESKQVYHWVKVPVDL